MMMLRSLKPCQITTGKVCIVSMENYSSVMETIDQISFTLDTITSSWLTEFSRQTSYHEVMEWIEQISFTLDTITSSCWLTEFSRQTSYHEIIRIWTAEYDIDFLMDWTTPVLIITMAYMQLFNGSINYNKIKKMINRISLDWKRLGQSPNIEIIHKYAARGRFITIAYSNSMYFACIFYLIMPILPVIFDVIVPLNESRKRNYLFEAEYGVNADDYYWPIIAHSYITSIVSIVVIISSDVMFFTMVEHACALFEIVGVNLNMAKRIVAGGEGTAKQDDYKLICHCIDLHREAILFADLIEASYSGSLIGVIGICVIMLSVSGVQTVMHVDQPEVMLRYGSFSIAQIFHLYFNSLPGQKLIDYSLSVFEHAYADNWDGLSLKAKKLLIMIMMRSIKPCQITAGKVYVVSMANYSSVMQKSMSYFTVLSSMR